MDFVVGKQGIVLVDFDDTIFTWRHGDRGVIRNRDEEIEYYLLRGYEFYEENGMVNPELVSALTKSKGRFGIYLLSACSSCITFNYKVKLLEKKCPGLFDGYLFCDSAERKLEFAQSVQSFIAERYGEERSRVAMIDDLESIETAFVKAGMEYYTPAEIMLYKEIPREFKV